MPGAVPFFDSAGPLRSCRISSTSVESESNHPPSLVVASAGRLAGWPRGGQTRCRQRDVTVMTDSCASRPPFCRHGWVTISQNSDLYCCLLLPPDPPSQPLPTAVARPSNRRQGLAIEGTTVATYPGIVGESWPMYTHVAPPYCTAPAGEGWTF